jgi:hypothetical protein
VALNSEAMILDDVYYVFDEKLMILRKYLHFTVRAVAIATIL